MLYCQNCGFSLTGKPTRCPFCGGSLDGQPQKTEAFPEIPKKQNPYRLFLLLLTAGMLFAGAVCLLINLLLPRSGHWSVFVLAGLLSGWIAVFIAVKKRGNLLKAVLWQVCAASLLVLAWDLCTGFRGWSVDFVLPILYTFAMFAISAAAGFLHLKPQDYLLYLVCDILLGMIPLILLVSGAIRVIYPSAICVAAGIIFLVLLVLFKGNSLKEEIMRRLHL